jgi:FkbH-like protein
MDLTPLKKLLADGSSAFWPGLAAATAGAHTFEDLLLLSALRKKAHVRGLAPLALSPRASGPLRVAIMGGYSLYPFHELLEHLCEAQPVQSLPLHIWKGDFDNYTAEIMDPDEAGPSSLYSFAPQVVLIFPSHKRCRYTGGLADAREKQEAEAQEVVDSLLALAQKAHERTGAEIILANFPLPPAHDPGAFRSRVVGSDWTFRKWVNLHLGLGAPEYVHICDLEFLAYRIGGLAAADPRGWFESKQLGSPALLADCAWETSRIIASLKRAPKKVLVLDLDNTLWGGVIGDDGIEGIELGDTSPRGEAFKAFQQYILTLKKRGVLLAVCSKNDHAIAIEPFEKHPDMALRMGDFVAFKANWEPKSENIRQIAAELNLGLDSFVFVDDNPAEVEILRQFVPEVSTICLDSDPSGYVAQLADSRFFEPRTITGEDIQRTDQYKSETERKALATSVTDMDAYLDSLQMEAAISEFTPVDIPRIAQLINKSNQFNLTTRRLSEAEVSAITKEPDQVAFSVRLSDRFGDHGLISVVIGKKTNRVMEIDTWLMSCRVLKRQVEDEVLNELVRLAKLRGCDLLRGIYIPTAKNEMVRDFYPRMGLSPVSETNIQSDFELDLESFRAHPTKIRITRHAYDAR